MVNHYLTTLVVTVVTFSNALALVPRGPKIRARAIQASSSSSECHSDEFSTRSSRRHFLSYACSLTFSQITPFAANAQFIQFPCRNFSNTYHFLRVGTTILEDQDIWSTNPLFLTNREDALSPKGHEQVVEACQPLKNEANRPTVVKFGLGAASIDTSDILGYELQLGRDRLIPEYTYLDPRSIGQWDRRSKSEYESAVWALDMDGGRPPAHDDGTSDETLQEPMIRLRQLMSVLETHYSGDTILLVFADGTTPAVLSCMMAGIPLAQCHALEFGPGELRQNVNYDSVWSLFRDHKTDTRYLAKVEEGKATLENIKQTEALVVAAQKREDDAIEQQKQEEKLRVSKQLEEGRKFREQRLRDEEQKRKDLRKIREEQARLAKQMHVDQSSERNLSRESVLLGVLATGIVSGVQQGEESSRDHFGTSNVTCNEPRTSLKAATPLALTFANGTNVVGPELTAVVPRVRVTMKNDTEMDHAAGGLRNLDLSAPLVFPRGPTKSRSPVSGADKQKSTQADWNYGTKFKEVLESPAELAAEEAMEAYLNEDDGEGAWLISLHDILHEDES